MTTTELKNRIAQVINPERFITIQATCYHTGQSLSITGVSAIYEYVNQQLSGWEKFDNLPNELNQSKVYFTKIKNAIIQFVNNHVQSNASNLNVLWQNQINNIISNLNQKPLPYNIPHVEFLLKIFQETPSYFQGVYYFLSKVREHYFFLRRELLVPPLWYTCTTRVGRGVPFGERNSAPLSG